MSLLLWFLAACGSTPTTIGGDAELVIWEVSPFSVDAPGLDAEGKVIEGAKALPVSSSAPEIVKVGTDGRLQCDHLHELEVRLHLLDAYARLGRWTGWDEELNALSAHAAALPASRADLLRLLEEAADAAQDAGWTQGAARARALVRSVGARASATATAPATTG